MKQQDSSLNWSLIPLQFLIGLVFILFNAPGFLRYVSHNWVSNNAVVRALEFSANIPDSTYSLLGSPHDDLFATVLRFCVYGIGLYFLGVFILAIRRREFRLVFGSIVGLITGICAIAIMLWTFFVLIWLGHGIVTLVNFLLQYTGILFALILGIVALIIAVSLWQEFGFLGLLGLIIFAIIAWFVGPHIWSAIVWLSRLIVGILPWIVGIGLIGTILFWVWDRFSFVGVFFALVLTALLKKGLSSKIHYPFRAISSMKTA